MHPLILSHDTRKGTVPVPKAHGPCQNGAMSDSPRTEKGAHAPEFRILLYSDDRNVRASVRLAMGDELSDRGIRWTETATYPAVVSGVEEGGFDLLILDGEAAKAGGMGISRQLKHEVKDCPPVLLLIGRRDDTWLADWSEADGVVSHPIEPFEMKAAVEGLLASQAAHND